MQRLPPGLLAHYIRGSQYQGPSTRAAFQGHAPCRAYFKPARVTTPYLAVIAKKRRGRNLFFNGVGKTAFLTRLLTARWDERKGHKAIILGSVCLLEHGMARTKGSACQRQGGVLRTKAARRLRGRRRHTGSRNKPVLSGKDGKPRAASRARAAMPNPSGFSRLQPLAFLPRGLLAHSCVANLLF